MKKLLFLLFAMAATVAQADERSINAPFYAATNTERFTINRIVVTDSTTIVEGYAESNSWISTKTQLVLADRVLPLIHAEGIDTVNCLYYGGDVKLTFRGSIPAEATRVDFIEGMGEHQWRICDIRLDGTHPYGTAEDYRIPSRVVPPATVNWALYVENWLCIILAMMICVLLPIMVVYFVSRRKRAQQQQAHKSLMELAAKGVEVTPELVEALGGERAARKDSEQYRSLVMLPIGLALLLIALFGLYVLDLMTDLVFILCCGGLLSMAIGSSPLLIRYIQKRYEAQGHEQA